MDSPTRRRTVTGVVIIVLALVFSFGSTAGAAGVTTQPTFVDTDVTSDTVWTADEGPYRVTADIAVAEGATLTIEPGTTVEFVDGASLQVRGRLEANDTGERVVFESFREDGNASAGAWGGLVVSGDMILDDARVSGAMTGLRTVSGGTLTATDLVVDRTGADGVGVGDGSQVTLRNASFKRIEQRDIRLGVEAGDRATDDDQGAALKIHSSTLPNGIEGDLDGAGETTVTASGTTFEGPVDISVNAVRLSGSTIDARFRVRDELSRPVRSVSLVDSTVTADGAVVAKDEEDLNGTVENSRVAGKVRLVEPVGVTIRENEVDGGEIALGGNSVTDVQVTENRLTNGSIRLAASRSVDGSTIADNRAYGGGTPLLVKGEFVYGNRVAGNGVYGAEGTGIALRAPLAGEAGELALHNNTVVGSGTGLGITFGAGRGVYNPGLNSTVRGNLIAANERGIVIDKTLTTHVTGNRIVDNGVGVRLDSAGINEEQVYTVDGNDLSGNEVGLAYLGPAEVPVTAERNYWGAESGPAYPAVVPDGDGVQVTTDGPTVDVIPFASAPPEGLPVALATPSAAVEVTADGTVTVTPSGADNVAQYVVSFGDGTWTTVRGGVAEHTYQGAVNHTVTIYAIDADGRASVPPVREAVATPTPTPTQTPSSTPASDGTSGSQTGPTATAAATTSSTDHTTPQGLDGFGIAVLAFTLLGGSLAAHRN